MIKIGSIVSLHGCIGIVTDIVDSTTGHYAEVEWNTESTDLVNAYEYIHVLKVEAE